MKGKNNMKYVRKSISVLMIALSIVLIFGKTMSLAMKDYSEGEAQTLKLSYFRYVNGAYTNGYALNTTGNEGESHHPIYQIISDTNKTNYYCLNAIEGESWLSGTVGATATYNRTYDLNLQSDLELLKNETNTVYKNIASSNYLNQILWILDNIYIPDSTASENLAKKRALLAKAGIVYGDVDNYELNDDGSMGDATQGYRYIAQTGYDYSSKVSEQGKIGYFYYDKDSEYHEIEVADELVEVAQQAALWYYTNYLDNNSSKSETYNVKDQWLQLLCSNGMTETNSLNWPVLKGSTFDVETDVEGKEAKVGEMKQEQVAVLCEYLIDAANNHASEVSIGSPLELEKEVVDVAEKTVSETNYYVVGPIKINNESESVAELTNTITVNSKTNTGAYISDAKGKKNTDQELGNYIGKEFYIAVPKSAITGSSIAIKFDGSYTRNEKTLWVSSTNTEQPIVEVAPKTYDIELSLSATIDKEFDLALRKTITKITDSDGQTKYITNEDGKLATRSITYVAADISSNKTATYKHRKDPVVVSNGDIVTYSITIYNEGDMNGYAQTIVDKLPEGLTIKGESTGTYTSSDGKVKYSYVYDKDGNSITLTNETKNELSAYQGGSTLSSETIEVECEVTEKASSTKNVYLTNIAYIAKEFNTETNEEVAKDRDSETAKIPEATQRTEGDKYTGYHGGNNANGDNNIDVYNDTNNEVYVPGREDDDDFEIVVVTPKDFDLALQKYISNVYSNGEKKDGRSEPTINTKDLASGDKTTATYTRRQNTYKSKTWGLCSIYVYSIQ